MRILVYVQNKDERAQIRLHMPKVFDSVVMVNSPEEALENILAPRAFDGFIMDDSFDKISPEKDSFGNTPNISELLNEIQLSKIHNPLAPILVVLRPEQQNTDLGTSSLEQDQSLLDRQQIYTELGATQFLAKPCTTIQIQKSLTDLGQWVNDPPKWTLILKMIRDLMSQNNMSGALEILDKVSAGRQFDKILAFHLLHVKCLSQTNKAKAIDVLKWLETQYPRGLSIKTLLRDELLAQEQQERAFEKQVDIFQLQRTVKNFELCRSLLQRIFESTQENAEERFFKLSFNLIDELMSIPPQFSRHQRIQIFEGLGERLSKPELWLKIVESFDSHQDIGEQLAPLALRASEKLEPHRENPQYFKGLIKSLKHAFRFNPLEARALETLTNQAITEGNLSEAEGLLALAQKAGASSLEYYTCRSRVYLLGGFLREASDILHKAVRIKADDPRVLAVRSAWQEAYDKKNSSQAP